MRKFMHTGALTRGVGILFALAAATAGAATFTVTTSNDSGAGSLRQAITSANATTAADTIAFNIPGTGPFTISPTSALPQITQPVTIDGYSQPGATPNNQAQGSNARILIQLSGLQAGSQVNGLSVCASNVTVRGLSITRFSLNGILVGGSAGNCATPPSNVDITGNFIGLAADGVTSAGNSSVGLGVSNAQATLGGATLATRNVIGENNAGIVFSPGLAGSSVLNNLIGTDASGTLDRGNAGVGVVLFNSDNGITVGTASAPNVIAFNTTGIGVNNGTAGESLFANRIFANSTLGIDLSAANPASDGLTANDVNDVDAGGNGLQNFPVISAITRTATGLHIDGTLDRVSTAGSRTYTIGVYGNATCDSSGHGEGEHFLGTFDFVSSGPAVETFNVDFVLTQGLPVGTRLTLTATDQATNGTSEFSACASADNVTPLVVTSTADTAGTTCGATCTLRQAITAANATPGGDVIRFNLPGSGVQLISPASPLPNITEALVIDGYSQPGSSANTAATTDNAVIRVRIDGTAVTTAAAGLSSCTSNVTIRGLSVTGFSRHGIGLGLRETIADCTGTPSFFGGVVEGNFVGLAPDGSSAGNSFGGVVVTHTDAVVGGGTPAARNVIGANGANGVQMATNASGEVDNNFIGVGVSGTGDVGNSASGIFIATNGALDVSVGTRAPNVIGFNREGVRVGSTSSKANVAANDFFGNDTLGIDLVAATNNPDGITANDVDDADTGGNTLQNFPVLVSAQQIGPTLRVAMSLDVPVGSPTQSQNIALYTSATCDTSGNGEGSLYLGTVPRFVSNTTESFTIDLDAVAPIGGAITATTTFVGNTSEFSNCVTLVDGDIVFKNSFE